MRNADGKFTKRRNSFEIPGHAHELTFSCFRGLPMLSRDRTRNWFIRALDRVRSAQGFELWAYVIMPEHAHVLLLPLRPDYSMERILKAIKQPVAQRAIRFLKANSSGWLERLQVTDSSGRCKYCFWQPGGGYDRNIRKAETAWASVKYIHENPVRRGLVDGQIGWPWSSSQWYAGETNVVLAMDACPPGGRQR